MLQVAQIRQDKEEVLRRLAVKNFKDPGLVEEILQLDDRRKSLKTGFDEMQAAVNGASREIGRLMAQQEEEAAGRKREEVGLLKEKIHAAQEALQQAERALHDALVRLPNLPHSSVPPGASPEQNEVVREGGTRPELPDGALPHWDLAKKYDLIDFELGTKITGSGFPVYRGNGARLQRALISYFLDYNTGNGYTEFSPPLMVNEATAYGTGQLPDKEGQMYYVTADDFYLIPTAEVPLTNVYRDEIVPADRLPIKMTAYTPCFRREAGSYGKDVRGLNRLHQFDKVEIVQIVHPEVSYAVLEEMVLHVERLLQQLQLPYRILRLCGGDMSFTSALTYDFEVYSAAQKRWLEVSSVSNFEAFQSNRMKIRFKEEKGKSRLLHTLNGSALALPRIVACLLENNQRPGGIFLPPVLHPYFGQEQIG